MDVSSLSRFLVHTNEIRNKSLDKGAGFEYFLSWIREFYFTLDESMNNLSGYLTEALITGIQTQTKTFAKNTIRTIKVIFHGLHTAL